MIDDRQTHSLPTGDALDRVARLHGLTEGDVLLDLLRPHVEATARIYDTLEADDDRVISRDPARFAERLGALGYPVPLEAAARIERWRAGTDRKTSRLNYSHSCATRMPSSALINKSI